jgi:hypothetical protein
MPDRKPDANNPTATIQVNVKLQDSPKGDKPPKSVAYAFSANGRFIAKAAVDEKGNAALTVPAAESQQEIRVVVGPEIQEKETKEQQTIFSQLAARNAPQQFLRVSSAARDLRAAFEISPDIWICWLRLCWVKGTLLKRIYSSGVPVDYPVAGVDVQIWEVDPIFYIISKLTDFQLDKISKYLLNPQPLPPGPDPVEFDVRSLARLGQVEFAQPVATAQQFTTASPEFESAHRVALSGNLQALRQELTAVNPAALRYLICALFPLVVTKRLVGTAVTDRCGHFEALIFPGCYDTPDLYFTASVQFFGFSISIYAPTPVSCYTYWNYQCGTEVTLYTNSIFAPLGVPCPPVDAPENYVLVRALGNVQLNRIYGTSTTLAGSTNATNIGQVNDLYGAGLDSPFGGVVLPRVEFDSSLRAFNRAMYYKISYRQGTSGTFNTLIGPIDRKYNHYVGTDLVTSVYPLGPKSSPDAPGTNLFEIPPGVPPAGDWVFPNPPVDHANAQFPTADLPSPVVGGTNGKYQLKLDLFDSAGNPVNIAAAGIRYFVPTTTDPDGTIHTADAATLGLVSGNSFIMTVHVDNRRTTGSLGTPALDGNPADNCGVFRYGAGHAGTVSIPFTASHPDNFATYSYRLSRGATLLTPPTVSGQVSPATNPATITASVLSLLTQPDGTVCDIAGFAEDLYVSALATDGWSRQSGLDSNPPPRAFVLAPPETP